MSRQSSNSPQLESLELRRLFSVSASIFAGSLATGSKADFNVLSGGKVIDTEAAEVMGATTFNGHAVIRGKSVFTSISTAAVSTDNFYAALSSSLGYISYGETITSAASSETLYFSPEEIEFPTSIVAGKTYKSTYVDKMVVTGGGHTTTSAETIIREIKLVDSTPDVTIKVPAGKFICYQLDEVTYAGPSPTPTTLTAYFAPGVGLVESVSGTGGEGELTSFHNA